jgi:cytochrome c-type biogenesis protein CcmH
VSLFLFACVWLIVSTFIFVFLPVRAVAHSDPDNLGTGANVDVYRNQLAELTSDLRHQRITREQFLLDREELEQRLVGDLRIASTPGASAANGAGSTTMIYWLGVIVLMMAILLYLAIGSPSSLSQLR